ncbi:MAG: aldose 1-epimerase family protein [Sulfitobacter sp.]
MGGDMIVLENEALSLGVAPLGAEMQYLRTTGGGDLLWHGDSAFWSGRSPVLFPIVGRAVDDTIAVGEHSAPMSQHGFARRSYFDLVEASEDMCRHRLSETAESRVVYPFAFALDVTHTIAKNTLHVSAKVTNNSATPMPFGFGFHPAFNWPLPQAESLPHFVTLASGGTPRRAALHDGLLQRDTVAGPFSNGDLEIVEELFVDGALVFPNGADTLRYGPRNGPALEFEFNNLPDLALWRPSGAPFLCIEPWHGTASYVGDGPQIAQRPNSITLGAGEVAEFGYSVTVRV